MCLCVCVFVCVFACVCVCVCVCVFMFPVISATRRLELQLCCGVTEKENYTLQLRLLGYLGHLFLKFFPSF